MRWSATSIRGTSAPRTRELPDETRLSAARWQKCFTSEFVHVAQVITELPASEAGVERLFSVLTSIFDDRRKSAGLDLIQAEMIRMWQIHHPADPVFVTAARSGASANR